MNGRFVSVVQWRAHVHAPLQLQPAAQAAAGFSHAPHASFWAERRRGHRTASAPTKAHAAGCIPGLCTRGLASAYPHKHAYAHARADPPPPKLIPSPARAGSPRPPRRKHTRRSPAIPVRVAPRACCCAVLGCIARAPTYACACGSRCQAARECEALGPRRAFFWRGGSAMAPRACSPERGMLRKKQGWPERRRSCSCRGALRATASPKQTDHPFKHDCTVFASIYSCYHECIHVSSPPHHN